MQSYWLHIDKNYKQSSTVDDYITPETVVYVSGFANDCDVIHYGDSVAMPLFNVHCVYTVTSLTP